MRGTYLKEGVETVSPERPLSIHEGSGRKTGLVGTLEDYSRLLKMATQGSLIQELEIKGKKRSLEKHWPHFENV